jgi:DNA-binding transcriptional MerR regulator
MKTLSDVLRESGLSYRTLVKYLQMGLLPKPQRVWRGRRGSESLYPDDVIEIISWVKLQQELGFSLAEIAEQCRKDLGEIRVIKPTGEYLVPIKSDEPELYLGAYGDFYSWLQDQINQQAPGHELSSVEMEIVKKERNEFLKPKEIKVRPKAEND